MVHHIQKILIVDDEVEIVKGIKRHLTRSGFTLSGAGSSDEAKAKIEDSALKQLPFDLVITDVSKPVSSGFELSRWIKQRHPQVSMLFLAGYGVQDLVNAAMGSEVDDFCPKPFSPNTLLETIHHIDQKRRACPFICGGNK